MKTKPHSRWLVIAALSAGFLTQIGTCIPQGASDDETNRINATIAEIQARQVANIIADTLFFVLDNAFVRLRT